jgi:putative transposase
VHVVFSTKARFPFIDDSWRDRLHAYIGGTLNSLGATPLAVGGIEDHVHFLAGLTPKHSVADLVREVKKSATKWVTDELRVPKFSWQEGYGAFTVCREHVPAVTEYIRGQVEHHRHRTFQEEYRAFLEEWNIPFDERYLW